MYIYNSYTLKYKLGLDMFENSDTHSQSWKGMTALCWKMQTLKANPNAVHIKPENW